MDLVPPKHLLNLVKGLVKALMSHLMESFKENLNELRILLDVVLILEEPLQSTQNCQDPSLFFTNNISEEKGLVLC